MSSIEDLERRLARVEDALALVQEHEFYTKAEVGAAVSQSADASRLSRGASDDVTKIQESLRGHNRVLEALRATQLDQGQKIDQNFAEFKADIAELKVGMMQIVGMLEGLANPESD